MTKGLAMKMTLVQVLDGAAGASEGRRTVEGDGMYTRRVGLGARQAVVGLPRAETLVLLWLLAEAACAVQLGEKGEVLHLAAGEAWCWFGEAGEAPVSDSAQLLVEAAEEGQAGELQVTALTRG